MNTNYSNISFEIISKDRYMLKARNLGPLFIAICMIFRATDVFFRKSVVDIMSPLELITIEHLIATIVLMLFTPKIDFLKTLSKREWISLLFISCGASVGGILSFTTAFQYMNPAVVILLQKLQPVITIFLSVIILNEKIDRKFILWSIIAVIAGYILSFGAVNPSEIFSSKKGLGVLYSLLAVLFWGGGAVFGKHLLSRLDSKGVTKVRYLFGSAFSLIILLFVGDVGHTVSQISVNPKSLLYILYMALIPGLLALTFYYKGLKTTKASTSSILELIFPLVSVVIVWFFIGRPLSMTQVISGGVLLLSIVAISKQNKNAS